MSRLRRIAMDLEGWSDYKDEMGWAYATDMIREEGITKQDLEDIAKFQSVGTPPDIEMLQYITVCLDEIEEDGEL